MGGGGGFRFGHLNLPPWTFPWSILTFWTLRCTPEGYVSFGTMLQTRLRTTSVIGLTIVSICMSSTRTRCTSCSVSFPVVTICRAYVALLRTDIVAITWSTTCHDKKKSYYFTNYIQHGIAHRMISFVTQFINNILSKMY